MIKKKRQRIEPTDDWQQLDLLIAFPEQRIYELCRPVVLFGRSVAERARQTATPQRTLYRQVDRFEREGMRSLFAPEKVEKHRRIPERIRRAILELKAEHPDFRPHEIKTICWVRFGHPLSHHTVKRILAEGPLPERKRRRFEFYHRIPDAYDRRHAIVTLHAEGWNVKSIAGYMGVDRHTVYDILKRWAEEGPAGLEDRSSAPHTNVRKVTLETIVEVRKLQENPELGAFRIHAALRRIGIELSPRTCGRILALNRKLYGLPKPERGEREPKSMPFAASRRHEYWTVDIRYLDHGLGDFNVYSISIIENFSRAVLASMLSMTQDLSAYLQVLYAAVRQHGAPEGLVSDSGGVFRAKEAQRIYRHLGIAKYEIQRGKPWQSFIETAFNVQRRMADWDFARATTWEELVAVHDWWVVEYNYQSHAAHQKRADGRRGPAEVLGWVCGRQFEPRILDRVFRHSRYGRKLDRLGYVRFRNFRVYGERGLTGERAAVWLYGENLTLEYGDEPLARYKVAYQPDKRRLLEVTEPRLYDTPYRSPQPPLWEMGDGDWLKVLRVPEYALRKRGRVAAVQDSMAL